jgi:hypothetical protein
MARLGWFALFLSTASMLGQSVPRTVAPSSDRAITFRATEPVLGLPLEGSRRPGLCSSDGLTYFDGLTGTTGSSRVLDLYRVAPSGEVRHLLRTVPLEFTNAFNRDFFAGGPGLVTLIEAQKRDTNDPDGRPREIRYYLSISDHDGDGGKLLALDMHFKPLKVAQFGSGEFVVLGWDEANELPLIAVLKEDGTVRRFIDFNPRPSQPQPETQARAATSGGATLDSLTGAAFVPFGENVLLTYPGTAKPIRVLSALGYDGAISLEFPPGYQLHDVLNSGCCRTLVARVEEMAGLQRGKSEDAARPPRQRMFEFLFPIGRRLREFTFVDVPASAVTCAANQSLAAIFEQPVGTATDPNSGAQATQLVVGSVLK